jgi:hypothetical protein
MFNGVQEKSRVTKRYAGKEQNEKCKTSTNVKDRKRTQRKRDSLLGDLRKVFAERISIDKANTFISCILHRHAIGLDWEEKPCISVSGWGDDPRNWNIFVETPEDRKIMEIARRPIPAELWPAGLYDDLPHWSDPEFGARFLEKLSRDPYRAERERLVAEISAELATLEKRSEATKRRLGLFIEHDPARDGPTKPYLKVRDLLKD